MVRQYKVNVQWKNDHPSREASNGWTLDMSWRVGWASFAMQSQSLRFPGDGTTFKWTSCRATDFSSPVFTCLSCRPLHCLCTRLLNCMQNVWRGRVFAQSSDHPHVMTSFTVTVTVQWMRCFMSRALVLITCQLAFWSKIFVFLSSALRTSHLWCFISFLLHLCLKVKETEHGIRKWLKNFRGLLFQPPKNKNDEKAPDIILMWVYWQWFLDQTNFTLPIHSFSSFIRLI